MDSALCAHEIFWPAVRLEGPSGTTQEAAKIVEESFARGRQAYLPRQGTAFEPEWLNPIDAEEIASAPQGEDRAPSNGVPERPQASPVRLHSGEDVG